MLQSTDNHVLLITVLLLYRSVWRVNPSHSHYLQRSHRGTAKSPLAATLGGWTKRQIRELYLISRALVCLCASFSMPHVNSPRHVVVVREDWTVICYDHELKRQWEKPLEHDGFPNGEGSFVVDQVGFLVEGYSRKRFVEARMPASLFSAGAGLYVTTRVEVCSVVLSLSSWTLGE